MDGSINYTEVKPHKKSKYFYFLLGLILFHVISNIIWIILNNQPPTWDSAHHTLLSMRIFESPFNFLNISNYYPPFVHLIGTILIFIFGYSYKVIQLTGTLFLGLSIIFIYLFAKEIFKSEKIAFFSSLFFSFFITIFEQSRIHMLDIPLTALVFASLYFLERSNNFLNKKHTLLFFISFALMTVTKWYGAVFIIISLIFKLFRLFVNKFDTKNAIKNILIGIFIFLAFVLPWYLANLDTLLKNAFYFSAGELADPQKLLSLGNFLFNLKLIIMFQTSFLGFLFLLTSLFFFVKNSFNSQKVMIFLSIIFAYLVFTLISNKNIRYLIPMMPFFAIIMGFGADFILRKGRFLLKSFLITTFIYMIISYFILSFGFPIFPKYKYAFNFPVFGWTDVYYLHTYPVKAVYEPKQKLPYNEILDDIKEIKEGNIRIIVISGSDYINYNILNPYLYKNSIKNRRDLYIDDFSLINSLGNQEIEIQQYLTKNIDFILISKNYLGLPGSIREYDGLKRFHEYVLSEKLENFEKVKEYKLVGDEYHPDDTIILLRKTN